MNSNSLIPLIQTIFNSVLSALLIYFTCKTAKAARVYSRTAGLAAFATAIGPSQGGNTPPEAHKEILRILMEDFPNDFQRLEKFMPKDVKPSS